MLEVLEILTATYLAIVLVVAGLAKIADRRFILTNPFIRQKLRLSFRCWRIATFLLAALEIGIGVSFFSLYTLYLASSLTTSLFLFFLIMKIWMNLEKSKSDCGCYGNRHLQQADSAGITIAIIQATIALLNTVLVFNDSQFSFVVLRSIIAGVIIIYILAFFTSQIRHASILHND